MHFFINEQSFHGQFHEGDDLHRALVLFVSLVNRARREAARGGRIWRSERLGDAQAVHGQSLHQSINHISGRDLMDTFRNVVYDLANPSPWEPERIHSGDDFYFWRSGPAESDNIIVTDTSLAELAERQLRDANLLCCLLNVVDSKFLGKQLVEVSKEDNTKADLFCVCNTEEFEAWLRKVGTVPPYGPGATVPPRDEQTCLINITLFEPTGQFHHGRRVYRHRTRKDLYYVDNLHVGEAAHLEVFDKRGQHLGEASLEGQLRPDTKIEGRTIEL